MQIKKIMFLVFGCSLLQSVKASDSPKSITMPNEQRTVEILNMSNFMNPRFKNVDFNVQVAKELANQEMTEQALQDFLKERYPDALSREISSKAILFDAEFYFNGKK